MRNTEITTREEPTVSKTEINKCLMELPFKWFQSIGEEPIGTFDEWRGEEGLKSFCGDIVTEIRVNEAGVTVVLEVSYDSLSWFVSEGSVDESVSSFWEHNSLGVMVMPDGAFVYDSEGYLNPSPQAESDK